MDNLAVLMRLGAGQFLDELVENLVTASAEVVETGKPAVITATFKVSTRGQGNNLVTILEEIKRSSPKKDPRGAIFFALGKELFRDDPRQQRMEFRDVNTTTGEIRDVGSEPTERIVR